jgi:tetratricopeptide (TPR) repeat protein
MADAPPATRAIADQVLKQLDLAAGVPETAAEASVRKGFLLFRLRRFDEALRALDVAPASEADRVLAYWRALFRGRVLEELRRPDDAARAFEDAGRLFPEAQSPRVALASLFQQAGRREEALAQRVALGALPRDARDPWWIYWFGDRRFVPSLLAAIRDRQP